MPETIVVTASEGSFPGLVEALEQIRVEVQQHPLISFTAPADWAPVDRALGRLSSYGAIAITSPRAAAALAGRIEALPEEARPVQPSTAAWAGGTASAAALRGWLGPVRTPGEQSGRGAAATLADAMLEAGVAGPVLFPCGETRREELPELLRSSGIQVDEVVCYRSVLVSESAARAAAVRGSVVVVASPSVANLLVRACPPGTRPALLAVGPTTASAARASGWSPAAVATDPTAQAVAAAVRNILVKRSQQ